MSVLVDRKKPAAPHYGKSQQNSASVQNMAVSKGSAREEQKENQLKGASGSVTAVTVGGRTEVVTGVEKMNMIAIQRVDGHVHDLLSTVPQVVLYQYEAEANIWERTSTEGTLFIYSRDASPSHGFVLLNRLSSDNLQVMIEPGSEYRVQDTFVLFKRHSGACKVYGLCFNDSSVCAKTGELLSSLSLSPPSITHPALSSLSSQAVASGSSGGRVVPLSSDTRSHSVPSLPHTQTQGESGGERFNILELLENSGNLFRNQQVSSDDTGSSGQESPPCDGISFTAHPLTTSQHGKEGQLAASGDGKLSSSSASQQKGSMSKERLVLKRSTPRTIPKLVNMNAGSVPPPQSTKPLPQQNTFHHVQSQMPYSSRVAGPAVKSGQSPQTAHSPTNTPKQDSAKRPLRSSTAPSHVGFNNSSKRKVPNRAGLVKTTNPPLGPLAEIIPEQPLARQLFGSSESARSRTDAVSDSSNAHLQNLFSQSLPAPLDRNGVPGHKGLTDIPPPIQPMSLAEIEKQMSEEVPSPDTVQSFPLIPSTAASTSTLHYTEPSTTATLSTSAPTGFVGGGEGLVLRQPSSFSAVPSAWTSTPPTSRGITTTANDSSTLSGVAPISSSAEVAKSLQSVLQRSCTTGSITVSVEPPSPVVTSQQTTAYGIMNGVFPNVPPLMHSPGMRAPPVGHSSDKQLPQKHAAVDASAKNLKETKKGARRKRGGRQGRRGSRSPGRSGSPEGSSGGAPSPQTGTSPVAHVVDTPSRSWSVPNNMSPVSVVVPSQPTSQPHTLLSPQQFSCNTDTAEAPPQQPSKEQDMQSSLSREHFKQALIHLIQNDDDFISRIHHAYQLSVAQQHQHHHQ